MSLQDFLNAHPVDNLTEEVIISPRFKDKDGNVLKFTIRAMTNQEFEEIRKSATVIKKGRKVEFDPHAFNLRAVIHHTLVPNFKDADSIQKLGCHNPEEYVERVLLAGEAAVLAGKISALSGFDTDMESLVEEAKN